MTPTLHFIYIDSGGGHRAAATALAEVAHQQQRGWDVRLVSIQDLLTSIDFVRKSVGIPFQDVYNIMLRHGWTLGTAQMVPMMHTVIRMFHRAQVDVLTRYWADHRPDMVVSLIPHYNRALKESLEHAWPGTPFVTILTDIADYPPNFWIERMDQHVICGSDRAVSQALALGIPPSKVVKTSGMILNPRFYAPLELDRAAERGRLGLRPKLPTGLVLFGGEGSMEMVRIAKALNGATLGVQLVFLCGRNQAAIDELRAMEWKIPVMVEGFTREIPKYMALSDFFIGKPGPGCISEALAMGLPVIVERNAWTLAHERYNADWVEEQGVGTVIQHSSELPEVLAEMLEPKRYQAFVKRVRATANRAVFEIPGVLAEILRKQESRSAPLPAPLLSEIGRV